MPGFHEKMITNLRNMARRGNPPSQMLRAVVNFFNTKEPHKLDIIKHMREAFCLTLQQAKPIAGWSADGRGQLSDSQLDDFLMPEILKNRNEWEKAPIEK